MHHGELRCSNSIRLPIHSGTKIRISWDAPIQVSPHCHQFMGWSWVYNGIQTWNFGDHTQPISALSKYPRHVNPFFSSPIFGWRSQSLPGKGGQVFLHGKSSNIKGSKKIMQLKLISYLLHQSNNTRHVSNNVSMYHHYRCYNCDIMIASHLKQQRHVDVEKPSFAPSSHLTVPHLQPSAKSPRNLSTWQQDLTVLDDTSLSHILKWNQHLRGLGWLGFNLGWKFHSKDPIQPGKLGWERTSSW